MSKKEVEVTEAEFTEVKEEVAINTEVRVGMKENGEVYFALSGTAQNLIAADGLLDYAKRELDRVWANRMAVKEK